MNGLLLALTMSNYCESLIVLIKNALLIAPIIYLILCTYFCDFIQQITD